MNAAQFVPYALLGLIAGVYTDRWRRKPILVWASVGRALSLGAIPILWLAGVLHIWILVIALVLFGAFSVFGFAATESLLPRLVLRRDWFRPMRGSIRQTPPLRPSDQRSAADSSVCWGPRWRDGLRWTYRHRTLGPLAASTHVWFLANGAAMTVLSLLALRSLGFTAYTYGLLLAVFGITSLIGASIAPWCGARLGSGRVIILARVAYPIVWLLVALAPSTPVGDVLLFVALPLQGFAAGIENSNEMGYWQALTPDELLGRANATRRSVNRTMAALGALHRRPRCRADR